MLNDLLQNIDKNYSEFFKINIPFLKNMTTSFDGDAIKYKENLKCREKSNSKKTETKDLCNDSSVTKTYLTPFSRVPPLKSLISNFGLFILIILVLI